MRPGEVEPLASLFTRHLGTIFRPVGFLESLSVTKAGGNWSKYYNVVGRWVSHTTYPPEEQLPGEEEDRQLQLTTLAAPSILDALQKFLIEKGRRAKGDMKVIGMTLISIESDVLHPRHYLREMRWREDIQHYYYLPLIWPVLNFHGESVVNISITAMGSVYTKKRFHDGSDNEQASIANLKRLAGAVYGFIEEYRDLIDNCYITGEYSEFSDEEDRFKAAMCPPFSKEKFTFL